MITSFATAGVGERCLRLWISRFNKQGIDGITYRPRGGRPRKLSAATVESEILPVVVDPSLAGQLHWTAIKLSGWLRREKPFDISYRTLVRCLHEQNYARRIPRPMPEPPDPAAWAQKRETCAAELAALLADPAARVFFGDEAGFEGEALTAKLLESLQSLLEEPKLIRSVCATPSLIRK